MKTLEALKFERNEHKTQIHNLESEITRWEQQLGQSQIDAERARNLQTDINSAHSRIVSIRSKIDDVDQDIEWYGRKSNSAKLMAEYSETMQNWALDKKELQERRDVLSSRLDNIRVQVEKGLTEARQAEHAAATAYAQAVVWSDTQAENAAATDAQVAADGLAVAQENERRQALIIKALKSELQTVDAHIEEADREFAMTERSAVSLATERLQEEWDRAADKLIEIGAKIYLGKTYLGQEQLAFRDLKIRSELSLFQTWSQEQVMQKSQQYTPQQILNVGSNSRARTDKAA